MPLASRNPRRASIDIWPGFVDALAQLLMVIIFILLIFTAGQFYLSEALSGRDQALKELQQQVSQLADLLALERQAKEDLALGAARLDTQLETAQAQSAALNGRIAGLEALKKELETQAAALQQQSQQQAASLGDRNKQLEAQLAAEKQVSSGALAQVAQLTAEIAALRDQLSRISAALDLANAKVKAQEGQIVDLGKRLNMALVSKVEELARYRSEFFGRLREILGNRPGIRVVGDRFVFQSEVLFAPGSADLNDDAKKQLMPVFDALKDIAAKIPPDINWTLEVEGHTDRRPIDTTQFPSNWELSTARAISVVQFAIAQGIPPQRVAAAGFADTQPIDPDDTPDAYRRNRRIELKLTERDQ
jgi:chemotaxis protein MotB